MNITNNHEHEDKQFEYNCISDFDKMSSEMTSPTSQ